MKVTLFGASDFVLPKNASSFSLQEEAQMNNLNFLIFLHLPIDDDCRQIIATPTGQDEVLRNQPLLVVTDGGPGVLARAAPPLLPILSHGGPTVLLIIKGMLRKAII